MRKKGEGRGCRQNELARMAFPTHTVLTDCSGCWGTLYRRRTTPGPRAVRSMASSVMKRSVGKTYNNANGVQR